MCILKCDTPILPTRWRLPTTRAPHNPFDLESLTKSCWCLWLGHFPEDSKGLIWHGCPVLFAKFSYILIDKWPVIVRKDALGDAEPAYYVASSEVGYGWPAGSLEGYCFNPLHIAFHSSDDLDIASRWWVDRINKIEGLSVKWPWSREAMHLQQLERGSCFRGADMLGIFE